VRVGRVQQGEKDEEKMKRDKRKKNVLQRWKR
jgi:hypothetical protein